MTEPTIQHHWPAPPWPTPKRNRRMLHAGIFGAAGIAAALIVGIAIGSAGATAEPEVVTKTVVVDPDAERAAELDDREAGLDHREEALDERAETLDGRQDEIAGAEEEAEQAAANTVGDGVWTVGVDIEPGTYRAADVGSDCYWAILVSGSNGSDIVENGIPGGGNPTVTVEEGQDFETARCGEWIKQ